MRRYRIDPIVMLALDGRYCHETLDSAIAILRNRECASDVVQTDDAVAIAYRGAEPIAIIRALWGAL